MLNVSKHRNLLQRQASLCIFIYFFNKAHSKSLFGSSNELCLNAEKITLENKLSGRLNKPPFQVFPVPDCSRRVQLWSVHPPPPRPRPSSQRGPQCREGIVSLLDLVRSMSPS